MHIHASSSIWSPPLLSCTLILPWLSPNHLSHLLYLHRKWTNKTQDTPWFYIISQKLYPILIHGDHEWINNSLPRHHKQSCIVYLVGCPKYMTNHDRSTHSYQGLTGFGIHKSIHYAYELWRLYSQLYGKSFLATTPLLYGIAEIHPLFPGWARWP